MRALLDEERKTDADQASVRLGMLLPPPHLLKAYRRNRAPQAFGMVAAVEVFADDVVERHLLGPHHVAKPDFVWLQLGFAGDGIHDRFDCKANAGAGDAAIRQGSGICWSRPQPRGIGMPRTHKGPGGDWGFAPPRASDEIGYDE